MSRALALAFVAVTVVMSASADAQTANKIVYDLAGSWWIYPVDGSPGCGVRLSPVMAGPSQHEAELDATCTARVAATTGVVAWRPLDGMVLLDAKGQARMTFVEDETALPSSPDLIAPRHYLVRAIPGLTRLPQAGDMLGTWVFARPRSAPCRLRFEQVARPAGPEQRVVLATSPCNNQKGVVGATWAMEGMGFVLAGPGDAFTAFRPVGPGRYVSLTGGATLTRVRAIAQKGRK